MKTPIYDFVNSYAAANGVRFHMPGHKGKSLLGCEPLDITEVHGADALYEADGIILESEQYAAELFGAARTLYSTEGASQCIRAMLHLACTVAAPSSSHTSPHRPLVLAARNAHKAFLYAAALLDLEVLWLYPDLSGTDTLSHSVCSCPISVEQLSEALAACSETPAAVYITSPDYLGGMADIAALSDVCHRYGTCLLVDNAHGAYLHFLETPCHPLDLGADLCCDSAHKTLPVLTGGAYLHISQKVFTPDSARRAQLFSQAKDAMALFGSTSPSYLTLCSLDLCNRYLAENIRPELSAFLSRIADCKAKIAALGFSLRDTDPLRITIAGCHGISLAAFLREYSIECEYADDNHLVLMLTPQNDTASFEQLTQALQAYRALRQSSVSMPASPTPAFPAPSAAAASGAPLPATPKKRLCSVREALFSPQQRIPVCEAAGRICAAPSVSCPPAIPIVMPGEEIDQEAVALFQYYHIDYVSVTE